MKLVLICIALLDRCGSPILDGGWALLAGQKRIPSEASRIHALKLGLDWCSSASDFLASRMVVWLRSDLHWRSQLLSADEGWWPRTSMPLSTCPVVMTQQWAKITSTWFRRRILWTCGCFVGITRV